jgi:hypothetical protein
LEPVFYLDTEGVNQETGMTNRKSTPVLTAVIDAAQDLLSVGSLQIGGNHLTVSGLLKEGNLLKERRLQKGRGHLKGKSHRREKNPLLKIRNQL